MVNYDNEKRRKRKIVNTKVRDDDFMVPEMEEYKSIENINYNVSQLKQILKFYKQKQSGNKSELKKRIYNFLKYSYYSIKIQKIVRIYLVKKLIKIHGPGLKEECVNETDFYSLEEIKNLKIGNFFSVYDNDKNKVYGFNIKSIKYYTDSSKSVVIKNPYTSEPLDNIKYIIKRYIKLCKLLKINVQFNEIEKELKEEAKNNENNINTYATTVFSKIDELGNYSDVNWFLQLSTGRLVKYIRELTDIWNYRAQLSNEVKKNICYPSGNPFQGYERELRCLNNINHLKLQRMSLNVMTNFISKGRNNEDSSLGAFYVLGALTLVNPHAANAIPWLYQSVMYQQNTL